jgi:predicted DNA-binding protein YlxM (UPF0122 family)
VSTLGYTRRMAKTDTEKMAALYRQGWSCGEIAAEFGITRQAIHRRLVRAGVVMRDTAGHLRTLP